jgi:hypothetical protein
MERLDIDRITPMVMTGKNTYMDGVISVYTLQGAEFTQTG